MEDIISLLERSCITEALLYDCVDVINKHCPNRCSLFANKADGTFALSYDHTLQIFESKKLLYITLSSYLIEINTKLDSQQRQITLMRTRLMKDIDNIAKGKKVKYCITFDLLDD